jgi:hypothetical protein
MAAFENTLYVFPVPTLGTASAFSYTSDQGATVWSTAPINYSGSAIPSVQYRGASDRIWALGGTGRVAYTVDGTGWVNVTDTAGPSAPGSFEALNGILYVANSGTNVQASSDGLTWASVGTSTLSLNSIFSAKGELYGFSSTPPNFVLFGLSGDGTLQSISPVGSIGSPSGEVVSLISTEAGVSFLKTTAEAYTISAAGLFTRVTDAQYPAVTVRGAVYLNGHLYVMEPDGTIWNSAEDDFTSWASTDFVTAEFEADGGVCLAKHGEYVIALGQFTTEAFYHAADRATASPLDPVGSSVMLIGCAHANSVAQVEQSLAWVAQQKGQGSTFHKGRFVVMMKGYGSYERISTPDVERVLDADAFAEVYADILTIAGHVFYVLTLVDSDITLAYDFRSQLWYEWSLQTAQSGQAITSITAASQLATALLASHGYSDGDQVVVTGGTGTFTAANGTYNVNVVNSGTFTYPITGAFTGTCTTGTGQGWTSGALDISASCYFDNQQLVQLRETGDVYVLDITGTSDNGAPIDFRIRTRNWDGGTNREKFQGSLDVVGDKVSSTGLIRYSDDDFQTYTRFKRVDLSLRRPRTTRGGSFSRRAVEFRHTLSAKVGISALEADIEMGEQ